MSQTWVINGIPTISESFSQQISFESAGNTYSYFSIVYEISDPRHQAIEIEYNATVAYDVLGSGWLGTSYRTVTFESSPTGDLLTWLQANAVQEITGYTITYQTNGGTSISQQTEQTNLPNPLPTTTRSGYTFVGWYTDSSFTTQAIAGASISQDTTLYAKWIAVNKIIYNNNTLIDLTSDTAEESNVDSGYTFHKADGSLATGTSTKIQPSGNIDITTMNSTNVTNYSTAQVVDANLTASNIRKDISVLGVVGTYEGGTSLLDNTVTFKSDDENVAIQSVKSGSKIVQPYEITKSGYVFKGWGTSASASTYRTFPYTPSLATENLYANWIQASKCVVTGVGSSNPTGVTFTNDSTFSFDFEEITKDGNIFIKIPTMYRKITNIVSGQITAFNIADAQIDSDYVPYPCFVAPDNTVLPYILIGKYMSSSTVTCNSVNATKVSQTIGTGRTLAQALGTGYQLYDWQIHKLFQDLVCCYKQTINTNDGTGFTEILGIAHQDQAFWIDGVAVNDNQYLVAYNPSNYIDSPTSSSTGYSTLSYAQPTTTSSEVSALGYDSSHPFANQPSAVVTNSSYNTYYCDDYYYSSGSHPLRCNVGYASADYGVFYSYFDNSWSYTRGVRLCYRPL